MSRLVEPHAPPTTGRTLKTAVAVLQVLRLLEERPDGVTTEEVARHLGKSGATACYLLNSLCHERYAAHDPATGRWVLRDPAPEPEDEAEAANQQVPFPSPCAAEGAEQRGELEECWPDHPLLRDAVDELYGLTRHRSYLATTDPDAGSIVVQEVRGRQGLPTVPGLKPTITYEAHALALGKALLARHPDALTAYVDRYGLKQFTSRTVTDPAHLAWELAQVREAGYAVDSEEYAPGIWCLAVPIYDAAGEVSAALGLSLSRAQVREHHRSLVSALGRVARELQGQQELQGQEEVTG